MQYTYENITYTVRKHAKSKQMKLSVTAGGEIKVSIPRWAAKRDAHAFIKERAAWIDAQLKALAAIPPNKKSTLPQDTPANRRQARAIITQRLKQLNEQYYNHSVGRVSIRNTKSRWGSASSKNNLNFSYTVGFLPPELRDYILIHELCHLKHMNHSPQFWKLVSKADPQYAAHRKQLKEYQ